MRHQVALSGRIFPPGFRALCQHALRLSAQWQTLKGSYHHCQVIPAALLVPSGSGIPTKWDFYAPGLFLTHKMPLQSVLGTELRVREIKQEAFAMARGRGGARSMNRIGDLKSEKWVCPTPSTGTQPLERCAIFKTYHVHQKKEKTPTWYYHIPETSH